MKRNIKKYISLNIICPDIKFSLISTLAIVVSSDAPRQGRMQTIRYGLGDPAQESESINLSDMMNENSIEYFPHCFARSL